METPEPKRVSVQLFVTIVPPGVQLPLPVIVTVPHVHAPDPTRMWFATGSNVAERSAGLTVMRLAGKVAQLKGALPLQTGEDPESEY